MNKYLVRLVACLLVPCLIADPFTASAFTNSPAPSRERGGQQLTGKKLFEEEAIVDPVIRLLTFILKNPTAPAREVEMFEQWTRHETLTQVQWFDHELSRREFFKIGGGFGLAAVIPVPVRGF